MNTAKLVISVLLLITVVATSFQFVRKDLWHFRIFDFPHVQLAVLTSLFLAAHLAMADYSSWFDLSAAAAGLGTLLYQGAIIFPYTPLSKKQVIDTDPSKKAISLSILEANILISNTNYSGLVNLVKKYKPDIVIALETDEQWKLGLSELETIYKQTILHPLDNTYGICFYSNIGFKDARINHLVSEEVPSIEMTLTPDKGDEIKLYIVHPEPPSPTEREVSTPRDAELVLIGRMVQQCTQPVIVAGDLNDVAWSHTSRLFQRIGGLLDPRIGRGFFNTFHADHPLLRWPLDHLFLSRDFTVDVMERLASFGSDHFPIFVRLSLPLQTPTENGHAEKADSADKEEARETVEKAREVEQEKSK